MNEIELNRASHLIDPHLQIWGWEIPVYLFLGGLTAGIMILSALLARGKRPEERSRWARWLPFVAPVLLSVGMLALFLDLAKRADFAGIQEWLSFYFKSPQTAPGLYPQHNLFIQLMKLKNTLRHLKGEDLITHLGREYYE